MAVFYNSHSGEYHTASPSLNPVQEADFLAYEALLHTGIGWHEYSSVADMNAAVKKNGWPTPTTSVPKGLEQAGQQAVNNAVPGLSQIGTFFSDLSQASTWIRVGQVLAGLILIAVGVARITHAVPIATKVAKAVGTKGLL